MAGKDEHPHPEETPTRQEALPTKVERAAAMERHVFGLVRDTATDAVRTTGAVAEEGVHALCGVATGAVEAVGEVGQATVRTAVGLLHGVFEGFRGVTGGLRGQSGETPRDKAAE